MRDSRVDKLLPLLTKGIYKLLNAKGMMKYRQMLEEEIDKVMREEEKVTVDVVGNVKNVESYSKQKDDTRNSLLKLTPMQLRKMCDEKELEYSKSDSKKQLVTKLLSQV